MEIRRTTNIAWRRFLSTEAGMAGILYLRTNGPSIGRGDTSSMLFDAGRVQGFKEALDAIDQIIAAEPDKPDNQLENP